MSLLSLTMGDRPYHPTARDPRTGLAIRAIGTLPSGKVVWPVMGGDPSNDPPETPPPAPEQRVVEVLMVDGKPVTAERIQSIMQNEKLQGERKGVRDLLTSLGLDENAKPEDVKARLEQADQLVRQSETEAETKAREAAEAATAAQAREAAAAARELDARKVTALVRAGLVLKEDATDEEKTAFDATFADAMKLIDVPADADDAAVQTAVNGLKARMPALFTVATAKPTPPKPPAPIPAGPTPVSTPDDQFEAGRQRAAAAAQAAAPVATSSMFATSQS